MLYAKRLKWTTIKKLLKKFVYEKNKLRNPLLCLISWAPSWIYRHILKKNSAYFLHRVLSHHRYALKRYGYHQRVEHIWTSAFILEGLSVFLIWSCLNPSGVADFQHCYRVVPTRESCFENRAVNPTLPRLQLNPNSIPHRRPRPYTYRSNDSGFE